MGLFGHSNGSGYRLLFVLALNIVITVAQAGVGFSIGSLSLLADALHNFSDVLALLISYAATKIAQSRVKLHETFGRRRAEIVAAVINTLVLVVIAGFLLKEAFEGLFDPQAVDAPSVMALAGLSILVNALSAAILHSDAKKSLNIKSAFLHLFSDMLTSCGVLAGAVAMYFWGFSWIDPALSIAVASYLVYASWGVLMASLRVIMHFTPRDIDLKEVEDAICNFEQIANIHHVHVWSLDGKDIYFEAHLEFKENLLLSKVSETSNAVSNLLASRFGIGHTVLQPEIGSNHSKGLIDEHCVS